MTCGQSDHEDGSLYQDCEDVTERKEPPQFRRRHRITACAREMALRRARAQWLPQNIHHAWRHSWWRNRTKVWPRQTNPALVSRQRLEETRADDAPAELILLPTACRGRRSAAKPPARLRSATSQERHAQIRANEWKHLEITARLRGELFARPNH